MKRQDRGWPVSGRHWSAAWIWALVLGALIGLPARTQETPAPALEGAEGIGPPPASAETPVEPDTVDPPETVPEPTETPIEPEALEPVPEEPAPTATAMVDPTLYLLQPGEFPDSWESQIETLAVPFSLSQLPLTCDQPPEAFPVPLSAPPLATYQQDFFVQGHHIAGHQISVFSSVQEAARVLGRDIPIGLRQINWLRNQERKETILTVWRDQPASPGQPAQEWSWTDGDLELTDGPVFGDESLAVIGPAQRVVVQATFEGDGRFLHFRTEQFQSCGQWFAVRFGNAVVHGRNSFALRFLEEKLAPREEGKEERPPVTIDSGTLTVRMMAPVPGAHVRRDRALAVWGQVQYVADAEMTVQVELREGPDQVHLSRAFPVAPGPGALPFRTELLPGQHEELALTVTMGPLEETLRFPITDQDLRLEGTLDRAALAANGRDTARLSVRTLDLSGRPLAGVSVATTVEGPGTAAFTDALLEPLGETGAVSDDGGQLAFRLTAPRLVPGGNAGEESLPLTLRLEGVGHEASAAYRLQLDSPAPRVESFLLSREETFPDWVDARLQVTDVDDAQVRLRVQTLGSLYHASLVEQGPDRPLASLLQPDGLTVWTDTGSVAFGVLTPEEGWVGSLLGGMGLAPVLEAASGPEAPVGTPLIRTARRLAGDLSGRVLRDRDDAALAAILRGEPGTPPVQAVDLSAGLIDWGLCTGSPPLLTAGETGQPGPETIFALAREWGAASSAVLAHRGDVSRVRVPVLVEVADPDAHALRRVRFFQVPVFPRTPGEYRQRVGEAEWTRIAGYLKARAVREGGAPALQPAPGPRPPLPAVRGILDTLLALHEAAVAGDRETFLRLWPGQSAAARSRLEQTWAAVRLRGFALDLRNLVPLTDRYALVEFGAWKQVARRGDPSGTFEARAVLVAGLRRTPEGWRVDFLTRPALFRQNLETLLLHRVLAAAGADAP